MYNRVHGPGSFPDDTRRQESAAGMPLELQELVAEQQSQVSTEAELSEWPISIHVPERYEEKYAYPLIVWFHEDGSNEGQLESVMSAISPQNYCGLGIQANQTLVEDTQYTWNAELLEYGPVPLRDLLSVTIRRLRQAFHIHSERIFLAGAGAGADVAIQQLCMAPDWYAGGVLLNPACGQITMESLTAARLTDMSLLWTVGENCDNQKLAQNVEAVQMARLAGATPDVRVTETALNPESNDVRFIDHWLLSRLTSQAFV